jgi:hypothetical protein
MMRIRKLRLRGLRGVLIPATLDLNGCSVVVFGGNGRGKSSFVDGLEWFYTGSIRHLQREGCFKSAYRHRLLPPAEQAYVELELTEQSLSSRLTLDGELREEHSNDTNHFAEYLEQSKRERLFLRYKELTDFVDQRKGDKRRQVAALIGLEPLEDLRSQFQWVSNQLKNQLEREDAVLANRRKEAKDICGIKIETDEELWSFVEGQCRLLGMTISSPSIRALQQVAERATTLLAPSERATELQTFTETQKTLEAFLRSPPAVQGGAEFQHEFNDLCADPQALLLVKLRELYELGLSLLRAGEWTEDYCPLCGQPVGTAELRAHLETHLSEARQAEERSRRLGSAVSKVRDGLTSLSDTLATLTSLRVTVTGVSELETVCSSLALKVAKGRELMGTPLEPGRSVDAADLDFSDPFSALQRAVARCLDQVKAEIQKLSPSPDEVARANATVVLRSLLDHLRGVRRLEQQRDAIARQYGSMLTVVRSFEDFRRKVMTETLDAVSRDVAEYFGALHPDDEFDNVQLSFLPEEDGVEFRIYHRGEEILPPRRFLSESHLNSLGLCLFLAAARAFNQANHLLVLDDVINSFDADHRLELATLLVRKFPDWQLLVFTHDEVWYRFIRSIAGGRGWRFIRLGRWAYEEGVSLQSDASSELDAVREALARENVREAAPVLRGYIEARLKELCEETGARLRFRRGTANEERGMTELLSYLRSRLKRGKFPHGDADCLNDLQGCPFVVNWGTHGTTPTTTDVCVDDLQFALRRMLEVERLFVCTSCQRRISERRDTLTYEMSCKCGEIALA